MWIRRIALASAWSIAVAGCADELPTEARAPDIDVQVAGVQHAFENELLFDVDDAARAAATLGVQDAVARVIPSLGISLGERPDIASIGDAAHALLDALATRDDAAAHRNAAKLRQLFLALRATDPDGIAGAELDALALALDLVDELEAATPAADAPDAQ